MPRYIYENESVFKTREQMGQLVDAEREKRSMTQTDLAEVIGCPQPRVSRMLRNPRAVSIDTWVTCMEAMGLSIEFRVD